MKKTSFEQWALLWLEDKKRYVKESTYANYLIMVKNQLLPRLGEYNVEDITREVIQDLIIELRTNGRLDRKGGLSDKTVHDLLMILKMILRDYGIEDPKIFRKHAFQFPVNDSINNMLVLNDSLYLKMTEAIQRDFDYEALGYAVSLYTGMRIGEVCALQWKDIDLEQRVISVTKTLQRVYYKEETHGRTEIIISTPKSKASVRMIPISSNLEILLRHARDQVHDMRTYLLSGTRRYIEPRLYRKHFNRFLENHGLQGMRFHDLRHTFATRCIEKGADTKTVSCLLGHSSVNITLNRYVHPLMEKKRECVELLNM